MIQGIESFGLPYLPFMVDIMPWLWSYALSENEKNILIYLSRWRIRDVNNHWNMVELGK
jgi:hypothetical protein